jgi:ParB/RepB/Spo0J family partition protein
MAKPKRSDVLHLTPEQLTTDEGFNVRHDMGDIIMLAQSIARNGVKLPLRGYSKGKTKDGLTMYVVTDGHRRLAAVKKLVANGEHSDLLVPFIAEPKGYTEEQRTIDLIVANDGAPLNMLEESEVYARLIDNYDYTLTSIAVRVGKSKMHISNCMKLRTAPADLQEQIRLGNIAPTTVLEMLQEDTPEEVEEKVGKAVQEKGGRVTRKDLKKTEIKEESGEPQKVKEDALDKMKRLSAALCSQTEPLKDEAVEVLDALIAWLEGERTAQSLGEIFYKQ